MELDKTHVSIRPRGLPEIGDLTLLVLRRYASPLLIAWILGALPFMVLNGLLVGWIPIWAEAERIYDEETMSQRYRYFWLMSVLIFLQAPLAGVGMTHFIGQAIFLRRPRWRQVVRETWSVAHRWVWVLGVVRGPIPAMLIVATTIGGEFAPWREVMLLALIVLWAGMLRMGRPFLPEILLLERCPLRAKRPDVLTAGRRSSLLHNPVSGDLVGRFLGVAIIGAAMVASFFYTQMFVRGIAIGRWNWSLSVQLIMAPAAIWMVAGLCNLFRFLSYLDTRIRLEGWEVELALRAEAARQQSEATPRVSTS